MTEQEWLECTNLGEMVYFLQNRTRIANGDCLLLHVATPFYTPWLIHVVGMRLQLRSRLRTGMLAPKT
jgi:hypothetical protein